MLSAELYNESEPVNIGAGFEITIKDLAEKIVRFTDFKGQIRWDNSYPDGQPRRCLDVTMAREKFGFEAGTDFDRGLKATIEWYKENRSRLERTDSEI